MFGKDFWSIEFLDIYTLDLSRINHIVKIITWEEVKKEKRKKNILRQLYGQLCIKCGFLS